MNSNVDFNKLTELVGKVVGVILGYCDVDGSSVRTLLSEVILVCAAIKEIPLLPAGEGDVIVLGGVITGVSDIVSVNFLTEDFAFR